MKKLFSFTALLLFGIYGIILVSNNKLGLYIHPRFFNSSIVASFFAILVGLIGLVTSYKEFPKLIKVINKKVLLIMILLGLSLISPVFTLLAVIILFSPDKDSTNNSPFELSPGIVTLGMIIFAGLLLPPQALSSITASQRSIDFNSINLTENTSNNVANSFSSTKNYTIGDWVASLTYNPDNNYYKGKDVNLSGFIFVPDIIKDKADYFLVSRFIITCCAVDARPVGLKVKYDWKKEFKTDQWVQIEGKFNIEDQDLIIVPTKISKAEVPANPYIY